MKTAIGLLPGAEESQKISGKRPSQKYSYNRRKAPSAVFKTQAFIHDYSEATLFGMITHWPMVHPTKAKL